MSKAEGARGVRSGRRAARCTELARGEDRASRNAARAPPHFRVRAPPATAKCPPEPERTSMGGGPPAPPRLHRKTDHYHRKSCALGDLRYNLTGLLCLAPSAVRKSSSSSSWP